jgi:hypothetical protein
MNGPGTHSRGDTTDAFLDVLGRTEQSALAIRGLSRNPWRKSRCTPTENCRPTENCGAQRSGKSMQSARRRRPVMKDKRAALYLRVSTADQTVNNQRVELEAAAAARGWTVVATYADEGISGAKTRHGPPAARSDAEGCAAAKIRCGHGLGGGSARTLTAGPDRVDAGFAWCEVDLFIHQRGLGRRHQAGLCSGC